MNSRESNGNRKRTEEKHRQVWDIIEKMITKNERKRNNEQIEEKEGGKKLTYPCQRYIHVQHMPPQIHVIEQKQRQPQDHPSSPMQYSRTGIAVSMFREGESAGERGTKETES